MSFDADFIPGRRKRTKTSTKRPKKIQAHLSDVAKQWLSLIQRGALRDPFTIAEVELQLKHISPRRIHEVATAWRLWGLLKKEEGVTLSYYWNPYLNPMKTLVTYNRVSKRVSCITLSIVERMRNNKNHWFTHMDVLEGDSKQIYRDTVNAMNILWGTGFVAREKNKFKWIL